jgi:hypothetical protein
MMPWFKVDDTMHSHPKSRAAGLGAMGVWALCGSYVAAHLTDGFVGVSYVRSLDHYATRWAAKLVEVGLWYPDERNGEKGWSFHDWDNYQPSKAQIEHDRKQARIRQQSSRMSRRESRRESQGVSHRESQNPPRAYPDPLVVTTSGKGPVSNAHDRAAQGRGRAPETLEQAIARAERESDEVF